MQKLVSWLPEKMGLLLVIKAFLLTFECSYWLIDTFFCLTCTGGGGGYWIQFIANKLQAIIYIKTSQVYLQM